MRCITGFVVVLCRCGCCFRVIGYVVIMFLAQTPLNGGKPRPPPVPPRPNKQIIDEAMARSRKKIAQPYTNGVQNKLNGQSRVELGQHVHENGQKRPTVLLIANGKSVCDDVFKPRPSENRVRPNNESPIKVTFQGRPNSGDDSPRIRHSNWYQVDENSGKAVQFSSCRIILDGDSTSSDSSPVQTRFRCSSMSALEGLPPLPKSLSGVNLLESAKVIPPMPLPESTPSMPLPTERRTSPLPRRMFSLDNKLAMLRKEMFELREMDLSLLSQLWSLNKSIYEFRQMQEVHFTSSPSSDIEDEILYSNLATLPEHQTYASSNSSSRSSTMDIGDV